MWSSQNHPERRPPALAGWKIGGARAHRRRGFNPRLEARFPLEVRVPTLVVAAGADPICATPVIERFAARLKAGHAIVLPGARHEILMERDEIRDEFWAAFDAFIPGTPDPTFEMASDDEGAEPEPAGLSVEELEGGRMDAAVAGGDH